MAKALKVGDVVYIKGSSLPRVKYPDGSIKPRIENQPVRATVVIKNKKDNKPGKVIGVELDQPMENHIWADAHSCDGLAPRGFGWWITEDDVDHVA